MFYLTVVDLCCFKKNMNTLRLRLLMPYSVKLSGAACFDKRIAQLTNLDSLGEYTPQRAQPPPSV